MTHYFLFYFIIPSLFTLFIEIKYYKQKQKQDNPVPDRMGDAKDNSET